LHPPTDRHVGQKNLALVLLPQQRSFQFHLEAFNFTAERQHVIVEARRGTIPRDFASRFAGKTPWPKELLDPVRALPVEIEVAREFLRIVPGSRAGRSGAFTETRGKGLNLKNRCLGPALATEINVFHPGEIRRVTVTGELPATARPGEIHVIRITQRIGQVLTGGYTLYVTLDTQGK
jgi:hypothetical protein